MRTRQHLRNIYKIMNIWNCPSTSISPPHSLSANITCAHTAWHISPSIGQPSWCCRITWFQYVLVDILTSKPNINSISLPNSAGGIRISLVANQYIYGTSTPHGPGSVEAGTCIAPLELSNELELEREGWRRRASRRVYGILQECTIVREELGAGRSIWLKKGTGWICQLCP